MYIAIFAILGLVFWLTWKIQERVKVGKYIVFLYLCMWKYLYAINPGEQIASLACLSALSLPIILVSRYPD
jgi:FtsH-binding integral membrane protein